MISTGVGEASWADLRASMDWRQGEHVTLIGPTGAGKTTLALALAPLRSYVVVVGTKPRDVVLSQFGRRHGYRTIQRWPPPRVDRVILWPRIATMADARFQRDHLRAALEGIYREGNWTVIADEIFYLSKLCGLAGPLEMLWVQGRSLGISLVGATQRPAWCPLTMYDSATHLFLWRENDARNLRRLSEISGAVDPRLIRDTVARLDHGAHEFLYVNTRTGGLTRSRLDTRA